MTRNDYIYDKLEPVLKTLFDTYHINHSFADASVHINDGWPIGTDVYIISGFFKSDLYIHKMYVVKEAINMVIDRQIEKVTERIKNDIYNRNKLGLQ